MTSVQGSYAGARVDDGVRQRVLVVDDEIHIAEALTTSLRHVGYDARAAHDGRAALEGAREWSPDLLLLDVMLPDMTGYDVCRELVMSGHDAGVIFLSARDEVGDRIRGFGVGADDYVTKPFSLEEVVARVRAVLLRRERGRTAEPQGAVLRYQDLELDDEKHLVTRAGSPVDLSPTEYTLLRFLLANPERVMSKEQILDHVWHYDFNGSGNVVETFVSTLRKKLDTTGPRLIQTVRGFGYVLRADSR
ncbi:MAG: response regulator transcription factor [Actinobacteria bacterium]|jgi:two-component system OmpR family response regulator|nr:response regulator transcription factor [Actinomycetota bacterium]